MKRYRIGKWDFDPASGELADGKERRRLEPRAARTLELLCEAGGEVVPQEKLIAEVWNGRSLSENSVSVVISQLRRMLDDDAKRPAVIETVPKRGYRVARDGAVAAAVPERRRVRNVPMFAILAILGLALAALVVALDAKGSGAPTVAVADVVNATGSPAYDPLAKATSELIVTHLTRRGFAVRRGGGEADLQFSSRLVLWNGRPSLGMTATDAAGIVRWSGMTNGTPEQLPGGVIAELGQFREQVPAE